MIVDSGKSTEVSHAGVVAAAPILPLAVSHDDATIPLFDLTAIDGTTGPKREELLKELVEAFATVGFGALYVPQFEELHKRVFEQAHAFFSRDEEVKRSYSARDGLGFVPNRQEQLRGETIEAERYRYVPSMMEIPPSMPDFSAAVTEVGREYNTLASLLGALLAEGIGLDKRALPISQEDYTMSIKHYPKPADDWQGEVVHPHHRDISPITILPAGTEAGLQVLREGEYRDIVVPEGYVVANTGELLCNKTAGRFYGADHRVVKKGDWPAHGRYQIALFTSFPDDFSLAPFRQLVEEATKEMNSEQKEAFVGQFMTGTDGENFQAYQINVIGMPTTKEKVNDLLSKGFLRNPSRRLKEQFPDCNWGKAEGANARLKETGLTPLFTSSIS